MKEGKSANEELEKIETSLLLEGVYRKYGYDFRQYSYASVRRRIRHRIHMEGLATITSLLDRVLHEPEAFRRLLGDLVIPVTEMFRDPGMFRSFRECVVPALRELPYARIWHAGCSTGEEVHSMAILLHEEGLLDKTRIYATDINENALKRAKDGIMPIDRMKTYTKNYLAAGGKGTFSDYYASDHGIVMLKPFLRNNVVFARHNLVTDSSFNEFHVILCRNVMIYFDAHLRDQVHGLFYESLAKEGFLVLGSKESLAFTPMEDRYETWDDQHRIYRKII
ncbi:CheR family methyltransferase [Paenibacillaceae bacterium WGS1546]|uniref:CheR family methyltransferase n=1 Tax=Cohnella sp. WGS1546 TaxID=3366810 RepID=UPI00372D8698